MSRPRGTSRVTPRAPRDAGLSEPERKAREEARLEGRARAARRIRPTVTPLALVGRDHPILRTPAGEVRLEDDLELLPLLPRIRQTCKAKRGVAIAAPQVGLPYRLIYVAALDLALANPEVRPLGRRTEVALEGCLSLPGRWYAVERHWKVEVTGRVLGLEETVRLKADGIDARMWQHEADHLAGRLIIDEWPESSERAGARIPAGAEYRLAQHAARLTDL